MSERVGIFGGTFDPPHRGHLQVARAACDHLGLDRLLWIPSGTPPHKESEHVTDARHRIAMTECMVAEDERFELETYEVLKDATSLTVETLQYLHEQKPTWQLVLIMGEDQWEVFTSWVRPNAIRDLAEIAVYRRSGAAGAIKSRRVPDHWIPGSLQPEASTTIRNRISKGTTKEHDVLDAVADYIESQGLYQ